ncbi:MAG TPA: helix-turn-helix transcriptional regulator [Terriglobales bacterium]|nr:helix-turn-helix transcriptional regulator [Terriglobales bacterium]
MVRVNPRRSAEEEFLICDSRFFCSRISLKSRPIDQGRISTCQTVPFWLLCTHLFIRFFCFIPGSALPGLMKIGETIRNHRLQRSMSQGDIEKRTGLLRCYLSRVENGHTIPSLDTLAKIASAMDLPLSQFFSEGNTNGHKGLPQLSDDEVRFLSQIRRYSVNLNDSDRKLVLAMVKKMAASGR